MRQCKSNDRLKDLQCQGVEGHEGPHWGYDPIGDFIQWRNKRDKSKEWKNIGASWTPAPHKTYTHPKDMYDKSFRVLRAREANKKK